MIFNFKKFLFVIFFINYFAPASSASPYLFSENTDSLKIKKYFIVDSIIIEGNKTTKRNIILRELLFQIKDTITENDFDFKLKKSIENLNNTSLFNFVFIDTIGGNFNKQIKVRVIERWYLWPFPILELSERNFNTWWKNKDLNKINYGLYFVKENFRGRKEEIRFLVRLGFEEIYNVSYYVPYIDKNQTFGLGISFGLSRNKEVAYNVLNNKLEYFRNDYSYIRENINSSIQITLRKDFFVTNYFLLGYNNLYFSDTLIKQNDFYSENGVNSNKYFSIYYLFKNDHRNDKSYPLKGYYFDFDITKLGMGLMHKETLNTFYIRSSFRKYFTLSNNFFFASGLRAKLSNNDFQPFFVKQGLGFGNDYVRGYEYYVVDGISYIINKNNIKYQLIKPRIKNFKFIKNEKFSMIHYALYLNLFADFGYAYDYKPLNQLSNNLSNSLLYGYGIGLDVVTYYDKVLRLEYSFNKMAESGIFINFVAPI